jgi:TRAP-type transport system periplasmic protein
MKMPYAATFAILAAAAVTVANVPRLHAEGAPIVMKLSTATIDDTQHEWMKRFAAAVQQDSGGRIKGELYPASQLGSIPRQIEGTQFGSIQGWIGPPEFLVGVDARYEVPSAPGLFTSQEQDVRVLSDPAFRDLILGLGADKGLTGVGIFPFGPASIVTRKPVRHLVEFKGLKIRMSASAFQLEMIKRMQASPVAMSLGDVLPAIQQGTIDGALTSIPVDTTLHYVDAAKYITEINQPWVNSIAVLSRKWLDSLPADLQKIIRDDAMAASTQIVPFVNEFSAAQRKIWTDSGGELISLPAAEQQAMIAQISSVANDMSASNPKLNAAVKIVFESAARNQ